MNLVKNAIKRLIHLIDSLRDHQLFEQSTLGKNMFILHKYFEHKTCRALPLNHSEKTGAVIETTAWEL